MSVGGSEKRVPNQELVRAGSKLGLTKRGQEKIRSNFARQASAIGNVLIANALGTLQKPDGERYELSAGQIKSAEIILRKTVPDLSQTEIVQDAAPAVLSTDVLVSKVSDVLLARPELVDRLVRAHPTLAAALAPKPEKLPKTPDS